MQLPHTSILHLSALHMPHKDAFPGANDGNPILQNYCVMHVQLLLMLINFYILSLLKEAAIKIMNYINGAVIRVCWYS